MNAHFRKGQFLVLQFSKEELYIGYDILKAIQNKKPTADVAVMMKAMEEYLFPAPRLALVINHHLCCKCCCMIDIKIEAYHHRTNEKGESFYTHQVCPMLKSPSERDYKWK